MSGEDEVCVPISLQELSAPRIELEQEVVKMERNKREKHILSDTAELFDLPMDLLSGLPHVELMGDRQFYMENHRGIISYSEEEIAVSADGLIVRVFGKKLELMSMTGEALRIRGEIRRVEWVK